MKPEEVKKVPTIGIRVVLRLNCFIEIRGHISCVPPILTPNFDATAKLLAVILVHRKLYHKMQKRSANQNIEQT